MGRWVGGGHFMNPFVLLFDFRGRINRAKFWLAALIYTLFLFGVVGITMAVTGSLTVVMVVSFVTYILVLISSAAVTVKRLHDRNKNARWLALFAVPVVLPLVIAMLFDPLQPELPIPVVALQYISFAISIWAVIELGCLRGTIGHNAHGPDPRAPAAAPRRTLTRVQTPG
jgi:uncharacterized membrane protein YhaH (DUF805 family)